MSSPRIHVAFLIAFGGAVMLPTLNYPIGEDQAIFAYIARRMLAGDVLYRDVWDQKLSIYFLYAGIFRFLDDSVVAIRALDTVWTIATSVAIYVFARRLLIPLAALLSGLFYLVLYADSSYWGMAQPDGFANLLLVMALLFWWKSAEGRRSGGDLLAGVFFGLALTLRPSLLLIALCLPRIRRIQGADSGRWALAAASTFLLGILVAAAPFVLYFALRAQVRDLWESFVVVNLRYAEMSAEPIWLTAARGITHGVTSANDLVLVCGCLGVFTALSRVKQDPRVGLLLAYWLLSVASVFAQRKFFSYHWHVTFAPFCLLAGSIAELGSQAKRLAAPQRRTLLIGYALIGALLGAKFLVSTGRQYVYLVQLQREPGAWPAYYASFGPEPGKAVTKYSFRFNVEEEAARYIEVRTRATDPIVVWGFSPLVYYLSHRTAPTRFFDPKVLFWKGVPQAWTDEYIRAVRRNTPEYVIVHLGDLVVHVTRPERNEDPYLQLSRLPRLQKWVQDEYIREMRIGYLVLFRKKR